MRKTILLFTLLFITTIGASAQVDIFFLRYAKPDYVIMTSEDEDYTERVKIECEYISNSVVRMKYYYEEGSKWQIDQLILEQAFDGEKNVVRESYYEEFEEGNLELLEEYRIEYDYKYDRDGRVAEYTFGYGRIDSSTWNECPYTSTIEYNEKGLRESATIYYASFSEDDIEGNLSEYTYDSAGNILEEKRSYDEEGWAYDLYKYHYGSDGRMSKIDIYSHYYSGIELWLQVDFYYTSTSIPEVVKDADVAVYTDNGKLVVRSDRAEEVSVYSVTGSKLLSVWKESGEVSVPVSSFINQILIVKGEGWAKKTVVQ